ncbi:MAG: DUF1232 domain-containing protein [Deltaproteobacteria bacterium]|nr:DUF1232 domain-containing protein [Deltaproteobacteria bacterium]MBN2673737.1 DUF1232 domain-containing protein [Deltaproteobacteria bacterium]
MTLTLTSEQKATLERLYASSRDNTVAHDIVYLADMTPAAVEKLVARWKAFDDAQVQQPADMLRQVQRFIKDCCHGRYAVDTRVLHAFTAALLYIVNPFDVIPDATPKIGVLDDVYVLNLALNEYGEELNTYIRFTEETLSDK